MLETEISCEIGLSAHKVVPSTNYYLQDETALSVQFCISAPQTLLCSSLCTPKVFVMCEWMKVYK